MLRRWSRLEAESATHFTATQLVLDQRALRAVTRICPSPVLQRFRCSQRLRRPALEKGLGLRKLNGGSVIGSAEMPAPASRRPFLKRIEAAVAFLLSFSLSRSLHNILRFRKALSWGRASWVVDKLIFGWLAVSQILLAVFSSVLHTCIAGWKGRIIIYM